MVWHIQQNDAVKGPYSDDQLRALCDAGAVNPKTYVWKQGYPEWRPLGETDFVYRAEPAPPPFPASRTNYDSGPARGAFQETFQGSGSATAASNFIVDDLSMWEFFTRAVTERFAMFEGRARRKEYWSFALFYVVFFIITVMLGASIDAGTGNVGNGSSQPRAIFSTLAAILYVLATFIPSLALLVRRVHDIGMSGWFAAVIFLPYIGGLIALIFTFIPTQMRANAHGPAPVANIPR